MATTTSAEAPSAQAAGAPIGVFDSGLGGLSVLREIVRRLPRENCIYVADSGHCPYGGKSQREIIARACAISDFLLAQGAKLIVVACNSATVAAVEYLRANYAATFVGMEPAVKPAVALSRRGVIGVLATVATLSGEKLHRLIDRHAGGVRVITQACPGLPEQVEAGDLDGPATRALVQRYTVPLLAEGADVIVLGSTHYPFLRPLIQDVVGADVRLVDTGEAVARRVESILEREGVRAPPGAAAAAIRWFSSAAPAHLEQVGGRLWGGPIQACALPG
ncbi:MAG: glutamate racemase [Nevskia sp.]|nr:glutamate racemase [Nevskia sp.]